MRIAASIVAVAALSMLAACAAPPASAQHEANVSGLRWKAVLVAGDARLPVFDNAVQRVQERLQHEGVAASDIRRLSAAPVTDGVETASLGHVLRAIQEMKAGPGQGCLVYLTSHGAPDQGLALVPTRQFMSPAALSRALDAGCGAAPTVAIVSGCFSGNFARSPMRRPNRVILTAARADRASFGCGAGYTYTVFDKCLLQAIDQLSTWQGVYADVKACVSSEERRSDFVPSEPQAYFGPGVAGLRLPSVKRS